MSIELRRDRPGQRRADDASGVIPRHPFSCAVRHKPVIHARLRTQRDRSGLHTPSDARERDVVANLPRMTGVTLRFTSAMERR